MRTYVFSVGSAPNFWENVVNTVPPPVERLRRVLGEVPVAIYSNKGTRVLYGTETWIDRLPRTWSGPEVYRIEIEYRDEVHGSSGVTLEECVGYLVSGVLGIPI